MKCLQKCCWTWCPVCHWWLQRIMPANIRGQRAQEWSHGRWKSQQGQAAHTVCRGLARILRILPFASFSIGGYFWLVPCAGVHSFFFFFFPTVQSYYQKDQSKRLSGVLFFPDHHELEFRETAEDISCVTAENTENCPARAISACVMVPIHCPLDRS